MEPQDYWAALRKQWPVIIVLGVIGALLGFVVAAGSPVLYKSSSSVFVSSQRGDTTTELVQGSTFAQTLVQSYAQLATTPQVLSPVISALNLKTTPQSLATALTVETPINTVIIDITVSDTSPARAARIANSVAQSLSKQAEALSPKDANGDAGITMNVISPAQVPTDPYAPNTRLFVIAGLIAGLVLALVYAFLRELLDTRLRTERDLIRASEDIPILGSVSRNPAAVNGIIMRVARRSTTAEDYRRIRTNVEFANVDRQIKSIVVTSPTADAGKSTTALNLAMALVETGRRGLLIDADLRKPSIAEYCQIDGDVGLTSVLIGNSSIDAAIQNWGGVLDVLPSGLVPPNPTQLLASEAMKTVMNDLTSRYDFVIVDSPPVLPVSDALTLAQLTDGVVVVARYKVSRRNEITTTLNAILAVNGRVLGTLLNIVPRRKKAAYYGYGKANAVSEELGAEPMPVDAAAVLSGPSGSKRMPPSKRRGPRQTPAARKASAARAAQDARAKTSGDAMQRVSTTVSEAEPRAAENRTVENRTPEPHRAEPFDQDRFDRGQLDHESNEFEAQHSEAWDHERNN